MERDDCEHCKRYLGVDWGCARNAVIVYVSIADGANQKGVRNRKENGLILSDQTEKYWKDQMHNNSSFSGRVCNIMFCVPGTTGDEVKRFWAAGVGLIPLERFVWAFGRLPEDEKEIFAEIDRQGTIYLEK